MTNKYKYLSKKTLMRRGDEYSATGIEPWIKVDGFAGFKVSSVAGPCPKVRRPLKGNVAASSTSSNKSYKSALISFRKIDSMRISNAEKISRIAKLLLGLHPPKHADVV